MMKQDYNRCELTLNCDPAVGGRLHITRAGSPGSIRNNMKN